MKRAPLRGFTLVETVVLVIVLVLLVGLAVPMFSRGSRRQARSMQSLVHQRGIHSSMVLFGQGCKDFYPGLTAAGETVTDAKPARPGEYGTASTDGTSVVYRMAILLRGNFLSPDYLICPGETDSDIVPAVMGKDMLPGRNYSYAMLNISQPGAHRNGDWRSTRSGSAALLSDRNIGGPGGTGGIASQQAQSNHTSPGDGWRGGITFNDGRAIFSTSDMIKTEYVGQGEILADGLFSDADVTEKGISGADAAMVFKDNVSYHGQTAK